MIISEKSWSAYLERLRRVNDKAASLISQYIQQHDITTKDGHTALLEYVEAVVGKYSEGAAEAACQMYDAIAEASGKVLPAAEPAPTPTFGDVAKTLNGTMKHVTDPDGIGASCARLVKRTGVDTTMQNAIRDGAEWAWVPHGDTCGFCLMLASNGWQKASKKALKGGHAEHIHPNCDCTYAIRFDGKSNVAGYDPDALYEQYVVAGETRDERMRNMQKEYRAASPLKNQTVEIWRNEEERLAKIFISNSKHVKTHYERRFTNKFLHFKTEGKSISEYLENKRPLGGFRALPESQAVPVLREKAKEWIKGLTEYEKRIIKKYTYNSEDEKETQLYKRINAMLRGEIAGDEKLKMMANSISGAIKKTRLGNDIICYRCVDFPIYLNREVGSIFKEDQFVSASVTKKGALKKPFKITIYAKKGTRAAYIEELSEYKKQRELLIDKDTVFRVISKTDNSIDLEVIS